jgi:hypothetical protein
VRATHDACFSQSAFVPTSGGVCSILGNDALAAPPVHGAALHPNMVPEEAYRTRHWGDGRLRVRELQVQRLLEELGKRGFLRERCHVGPFLLSGPMWSTHEDDEVIGVPDGNEHDVAGPLVTVAIAIRTVHLCVTDAPAAISQQGLATTCKDSSDEGKPEVDERDLAWRMSLSERRRRGNAHREDPGDPPGGVTPQRGKGALGTWRARALHRTGHRTGATTPARGVCAPALEFRLLWEGPAGTSQPDSGNPTVRDENGGLGKRGHGSRTEVRRRKPRRHHRTLQRARPRSIQTQPWHYNLRQLPEIPAVRVFEFPDSTGPTHARVGPHRGQARDRGRGVATASARAGPYLLAARCSLQPATLPGCEQQINRRAR